jgi:membrane protein implicated in regulation of membrane protease activity
MNLLADWQWEGVATAVLALLILCGLIKWLNENKRNEINQTIDEDIQNQQIRINTEQVAADIGNAEFC